MIQRAQRSPLQTARRKPAPALKPWLVSLLLAGVGTSSAYAQSLMDLYQAARDYDATYLGAIAQAKAAEYKAKQANALRLPTVGLSASVTRQHVEAPIDPAYAAQLHTDGTYNNTAQQVALQARQPLFNLANNATISGAEKGLAIAQAEVLTAEQDLIVRLSQAYFDVLNAQDSLGAAQATRKAIGEQLAAAKRNFEVGNVTVTDVREAQARSDAAAAQEIAATNELMTKRAALDQLVGRPGVAPKPLMTPTVMPPLQPAGIDEWITQAEASPNVRKAQLGVEIAKEETRKAKAGHYPTVDLVGSVQRTHNNAVTSPGGATGDTDVASLGVQANVPLFAGFAVQNQVKEKLASEDKSQRDLDAARRAVQLGTRTAYLGVQSGQALVKANEAAESSYKLALEATQLGYRVGVRVNLDVLNAQRELFNSQRDLAKSRYDVIVAGLKLRQAAGTLNAADLESIDKLLAK